MTSLQPHPLPKKVLVTGGCGFIGSNFLNLLVPLHPNIDFVNLDALTYAGNPLNVAKLDDRSNYRFVHSDIRDSAKVEKIFESEQPDWIVHFAAESHVDRSIEGPRAFIETNIIGTYNLLDAARNLWAGDKSKLFHHVSTDEVYGSLGAEGKFTEETRYDPSSPYSASKAGSDHLVNAYHRTYGLPVTISNCSNNYGPYQFPEKLIPLMILNALSGKPLPVYGDGSNVRDWLYVGDHCEAIWEIATKGRRGETYNVGGDSERSNLEVVTGVLKAVAELTGGDEHRLAELITYVKDRPGHDFRYAIDASKVSGELDWAPSLDFEEGLRKTVEWYLTNSDWVAGVTTGEYRNWLAKNYERRGEHV